LSHDQGIGKTFHAVGSLLYLLAVALGLLTAMRGLTSQPRTDSARAHATDAPLPTRPGD
jgi:hypothetical protein